MSDPQQQHVEGPKQQICNWQIFICMCLIYPPRLSVSLVLPNCAAVFLSPSLSPVSTLAKWLQYSGVGVSSVCLEWPSIQRRTPPASSWQCREMGEGKLLPECPANLFECIVLVGRIPSTRWDITIPPFITLSAFSYLLGRRFRRHCSVLKRE